VTYIPTPHIRKPTRPANKPETNNRPKVINHFLFPSLKLKLIISEIDISGLNAYTTVIKDSGTKA
jgi:hypothetical protein